MTPVLTINDSNCRVLVSAMLLSMAACSQPPNYAPVKTVNQAIAPENGYVRNSPQGKRKNQPIKPQQIAQANNMPLTVSQTQQNPVITPSSPGIISNKLAQTSSADKKTQKNHLFKDKTSTLFKAEKPEKSKLGNADEANKPVLGPQKLAQVDQKAIEKNKALD
jgi:hypothetical protein